MKKTTPIRALLYLTLLLISFNSKANKSFPDFDASATTNIFIENKGQLVDFDQIQRNEFLFYSKSEKLDIYFRKEGITYIFKKGNDFPNTAGLTDENETETIRNFLNEKTLFYRMDFDFINSSNSISIEGIGKSDYYSNFYYAHCPNGILNVSAFEKIKYTNVYEGIDFEFYINNGKIKYDIILQPNANINNIQLNYNGAEIIHLMNNELKMQSPVGEIIESLPKSFTINQSGTIKNAFVHYRLNNNNTIQFLSDYSPSSTLIIDPQISWTTYYDGAFWGGTNSSIDVKGNQCVISSYGFNSLIPTLNPGGSAYFQNTNAGSGDFQLLQFNTNGVLFWATYYGGTGYENTSSVKLDYTGNIYLTGNTESTNIPTQNAGGYFDGNYTAGTFNPGLFIIKFNANGVRLWATYYDYVSYPFLDVDSNNNLFILARSEHNNPSVQSLSGAYNQALPSPAAGGGTSQDLFIIKFSSSTNRLWATNLGSTCDEFPQEIKCGSDNFINILAYGDNYYGTGIITQNAGGYYDNTLGIGTGGSSSDRDDALIYRFNTSCALVWGTAFSGTKNENMQNGRLTTDANNNIYIYGETISTDLPFTNPGGGAYYDNTFNGPSFDPFIARFNSSTQLTWCTYFGADGLGFGMNFSSYIGFNNSNNLILITTEGGGLPGSLPVVSRTGDYNSIKTSNYMSVYIAEFSTNLSVAWSAYYAGIIDRNTLGDAALHSNSCGYEVYITTRWEKYNVAAIDPPWVNPGGGAYFDNTFDNTNQSGLITRFSKLPSSTSQSTSMCANDSVALPGGSVVYVPGTYYDTLTNGSGCDSVITTIVTVKPVSNITVNTNICSGASYTLPGGGTANTTGIYKDTLTNSQGCDSIITTNLSVNSIISTTISPTICYGNSYTLPGGNNVSSSGVYKDTLTAQGGCDSVVTTNLTVNPIINTTQNVSICLGNIYTLPGGQTTGNAGSYVDTLSTTGGCDSMITTNITVNPVYTFNQQASICLGGSYTLPGGGNVNTAGTYHDTLNSMLGCDSIINTTLSIDSLPVVSNVNTVSLNCIILSDTIFVISNPINASYSWSGPGIVSGSITNTPIVNAPGTYTVTITNPNNGCSNTATVIVNQNISIPNVTANAISTLTCVNQNAQVNASSTTTGVTYSWNGPGIVSGNSNATVTVNSTGTYTITVTNPANGCTNTALAVVSSNITPPNLIAGNPLTLHCNQTSGNINVSSSTTGATYNWSGPAIISGGNTSSPLVNASGTYTVIVTDPSNGCTTSSTINVNNASNPIATASASPVTITLGNSTQLNATGGPSYNWTPSNDLSCSTCANPVATPADTTTYCVTVTDQYGCMDTACVTIYVIDECPPLTKENMIPNIFTPNGDGQNDEFAITDWNNACTSEFLLQIFDRWGIKIFETNSYNVFWDGKTTSGVNVVDGTYYYLIRAKRTRGTEKTYKGTVSVIK